MVIKFQGHAQSGEKVSGDTNEEIAGFLDFIAGQFKPEEIHSKITVMEAAKRLRKGGV